MKKTVAFFLNSSLADPGGGEKIMINIANQMAEEKEVFIIAYDLKEPFYKISPKVQLIDLKYRESDNKYTLLKKLILLNKKIKKYKITDLVSLGYRGAALMFFEKMVNPRLSIYHWEHNSFFQPKSNLENKYFKYLAKYNRKVIILNKTDTEEYKKLIGEDKVVNIPNPLLKTPIKFSKLDGNTVLTVGRIVEVKGYPFLIDVIAIVKKEIPTVKLIILGKSYDNGETKKIQDKIKTNKLENNIDLVGETLDVESYYLKSDVYTCTSYNECFPLTIMESMSYGVPVVSFDCNSGPRDLIVDGKNGYLVEEQNVSEMAKKIINLLKTRKKLKELGKNSRKEIQKYDLKEILSRWDRLFE